MAWQRAARHGSARRGALHDWCRLPVKLHTLAAVTMIRRLRVKVGLRSIAKSHWRAACSAAWPPAEY
jgi:hypothetical protein